MPRGAPPRLPTPRCIPPRRLASPPRPPSAPLCSSHRPIAPSFSQVTPTPPVLAPPVRHARSGTHSRPHSTTHQHSAPDNLRPGTTGTPTAAASPSPAPTAVKAAAPADADSLVPKKVSPHLARDRAALPRPPPAAQPSRLTCADRPSVSRLPPPPPPSTLAPLSQREWNFNPEWKDEVRVVHGQDQEGAAPVV